VHEDLKLDADAPAEAVLATASAPMASTIVRALTSRLDFWFALVISPPRTSSRRLRRWFEGGEVR
jgi:hypothetical protein